MKNQNKPRWRLHNGSRSVPENFKPMGGILYRGGDYLSTTLTGSFGSYDFLWETLGDDESDIVAYELKEEL